ncbi:MAG: GNAT family N-acetyltransferase [Pseudomonadota bacterium]
MKLVELDPAGVAAANAHLARHVRESGRYGVHWIPYDPVERGTRPFLLAEALSKATDELGWERWIVVHNDSAETVGHAFLKGASFGYGQHRCELGMGLEQPYWRRGLGSRLLRWVVERAQAIATVDWLDLRVLGGNAPAIALYQRFGFEETARVPDFCRIQGDRIAEVRMSLWVGNGNPVH